MVVLLLLLLRSFTSIAHADHPYPYVWDDGKRDVAVFPREMERKHHDT